MPFTISHAAVIFPFGKKIKERGLLVALIIGSMMPDLVYFLPFDLTRRFSHSLESIYQFHFPVGLLLVVLFYLFFRKPLILLLPLKIRWRIDINKQIKLSFKFLIFSSLFLFIGICSHLFLDSFTHATGYFVQKIPLLQKQFFDVYIFYILQYLGSVLGALILFILICRWYKKAEIIEKSQSTKSNRFVISIIIFLNPIIFSVILSTVNAPFFDLRSYIANLASWAIFTGGKIYLFEIFIWSTIWNIVYLLHMKKLKSH